jgi:hypothetical protein
MNAPVSSTSYEAFLQAKAAAVTAVGVPVSAGEVHPILKPHQAAIVRWAVQGGRRAIFAAFGLGKSLMQIETLRLVTPKDQRSLIVAPLGVRAEFIRDAALVGVSLKFVRRIEECAAGGMYITNYETIRDGKIDPGEFAAVSLDEASCLRGFGGTKTFREFMRLFDSDAGAGRVPFRFVATATPSPNDYIEFLAYAAFLGIMQVGEAKTRFFKRDATKADALTIHSHKEAEFWAWVASWAVILQKPSDLGFSDEGYDLPPLTVHYHEVRSDLTGAQAERDGQGVLLRNPAIGVQDAAREKRETLATRVEKMQELIAAEPGEHWLLWHDLEAERFATERAVPGCLSVYGTQELEEREAAVAAFADGHTQVLTSKPVLLGSGTNLQRHCARAIFLGIGFKFNDFIQAVHRLQRFQQPRPVEIHVIHSEGEREVLRTLKRKWDQHEKMVARMAEIIREYGLSANMLASVLKRSIGCERIEVVGDNHRLVNNDCVEEAKMLPDNSVHLVVTSIPFSTQYEYTPSYNDFGHTDDNAHFWEQMDFLTPELLRALSPGRVAAIHVKDRITPGGINGFGFQTVEPFSDECVAHFRKHGFAFLARKTITTDVVRENNQTYRLGWTEQCKDGSRMGCGMPEYVLLFRKPPSDRSNGYADIPVVKSKERYTRARWQLDAHGYSKSSGDRHLAPEEIAGLAPDAIYKLWREADRACLYNFEHHVRIGEFLEVRGQLPPTFMLLPPHSIHEDVWTDITRMRTLNGAQSAAGREMHLCPLQFDVVDRLIEQFSQPGETILDPFGGIMTVPFCAVKMRRKGIGFELNARYFRDGVTYAQAAEQEIATPSLFSLMGEEEQSAEAAA